MVLLASWLTCCMCGRLQVSCNSFRSLSMAGFLTVFWTTPYPEVEAMAARFLFAAKNQHPSSMAGLPPVLEAVWGLSLWVMLIRFDASGAHATQVPS
jgi:hypothetical protein